MNVQPTGPVDATVVAFRPIRSGNAFEDCVERVLSAVKLGLVPAGAQLPPERALAARLGVSRVTLRDALHSLTAAGWLEVRRGRHGGTFVRDLVPARSGPPARRRAIPATDIEDTLILRQVLELGAVEVAAGASLTADAERAVLTALEECRSSQPDRYRTADSRLHLAITELTGSAALTAAAADVRTQVNNLLDAIPLLERNIAHSNDQHDRIVHAIRRGHPGAARAAMAEHLAGTAALLHGFLS